MSREAICIPLEEHRGFGMEVRELSVQVILPYIFTDAMLAKIQEIADHALEHAGCPKETIHYVGPEEYWSPPFTDDEGTEYDGHWVLTLYGFGSSPSTDTPSKSQAQEIWDSYDVLDFERKTAVLT